MTIWDEISAMNVDMGEQEFRKNVDYFEKLLAPSFAMQRANAARTIVDRTKFLTDLASSTPKARTTQVESISMLGQNRMVVTCVVTMDGARFQNLRVFVRNPQSGGPEWLLLAWANEQENARV